MACSLNTLFYNLKEKRFVILQIMVDWALVKIRLCYVSGCGIFKLRRFSQVYGYLKQILLAKLGGYGLLYKPFSEVRESSFSESTQISCKEQQSCYVVPESTQISFCLKNAEDVRFVCGVILRIYVYVSLPFFQRSVTFNFFFMVTSFS